MPQNFSPSPLAAPLAGANGLVSVGWNGYFTQYDTLQPGILMGRASDVQTGPPQQITLGAGLTLTGKELTAYGLGGDVVGPPTSTDSALSAYDGTTGKLLKDSTVLAAWFDQAVTVASAPTFAGLTSTGAMVGTAGLVLTTDQLFVNNFALSVTAASAINQDVKTSASPAFTGLTVNGHLVTVSGAVTLNDWFDQSVKAAASPTFNGLTLTSLSVNSHTVTVSGATTLDNWFDQSVKVAASPTFAAMRSTGNVRADGAFASGTTVGATQTGLSVALHAGPDAFMNFDLLGGIACNVSFTPT